MIYKVLTMPPPTGYETSAIQRQTQGPESHEKHNLSYDQQKFPDPLKINIICRSYPSFTEMLTDYENFQIKIFVREI